MAELETAPSSDGDQVLGEDLLKMLDVKIDFLYNLILEMTNQSGVVLNSIILKKRNVILVVAYFGNF
jgi:hypothetical protein